MKKYLTFFRLRFQVGLQYRAATVSGLVTQMPWALMEILAYRAIHQSNEEAFPMEFAAVVSYIWLRQAFFVLFTTWNTDNEIFDMILDGGIAYEMCRPVSVYRMWFARTTGGRLSNAAMRCGPILLIAFLMPEGYRLGLPFSPVHLLLFIAAMFLGVAVTAAFCMLVYILCFFTLSPVGVRLVFMGAVEFLSGAIIPLPFVPYPVRGILELLPFASMMNVPFRIYSGDLRGMQMVSALILQAVWVVILTAVGQWLYEKAQRRIVVQGG